MRPSKNPEPAPRGQTRRTPATSPIRTSTIRTSTIRTTRGAATVRSQGKAAGSQLVESLNGLVEELIKENKRLHRQVEKLSNRAPGTAAAGLERGLKAIQRRIEKTLAGAAGKTTAAGRRTARSSEPKSRAGSSKPAPRSRRKPDASSS